jgi:branched-chain amino acid transport system substrate-binding protein
LGILRKTLITSLLLLTVIASLLGSCAKAEIPATVSIGALLSFTGSGSAYAMTQRNGIELAVHEINASSYLGAGKELKVIFADTGSSADTAVTAMQELLDKKVVAIIGPTLSAEALKADPLAQKKGIPVMGISNTAAGITEMGDYIFRDSLPESSVIDGTIKVVTAKLDTKKAAVLWGESEAYTVGGYNAFTAALKKYNVEIVKDKTFKLGDTDFKAQLNDIIAANPDAICVSALAKEAIGITKQARELGYTGPIIGGNGFNTKNVITQAGAAAEGVIVGTAWNYESQDIVNVDFIKAYKEFYGSNPDQFATQAYTSVWLYAKAILAGNSVSPKALRNELLKIKSFVTPLGEFSFTKDREPDHISAVQIVKDGAFTILK